VVACLCGNDLPGIVCRPTLDVGPGQAQLAFPSPSAMRARGCAARCGWSKRDIVALTDPYRVAARVEELSGVIGDAARAVVARGAACGVRVGLLGSAALAVVTGLPYTCEASDLDLLVSGDAARLERFAADAEIIAQGLGRRIDIELELKDGSGVKLAEWLSPSRSLLAKSLDDVRMIDRTEAFAIL
jgi:phosphoribosyl-dephospho-CoA transferase